MHVDIAVVGGGPSGCSAALTLRAEGYSVAVISATERTEKPTETVTPQLKQLLRSIDAESALSSCEPCFGICSSWGRDSLAMLPGMTNPLGHAWLIHRARFDSSMKDLVRNAGGIWIDERARGVPFESSQIYLMTSGTTVNARWIVLATGSTAWSARMTRQKAIVRDVLVAFWAHLPQQLEGRLLFVEPVNDGWWYLCPDDAHGTIACFVTDATSARRLRPAQALNWNTLFRATPICQRLEFSTSATRIHVAPTGLAALPRAYGLNWIAVGEAAVRLDPLGSSGTSTAIMSGMRAARAVDVKLRGNSTGLESYARWCQGLFKEFTRQRAQQYAIEQFRREGEFWAGRRGEKA